MIDSTFQQLLGKLQSMAVAGDIAGYRALIGQLAAVGRVEPYEAPIMISTLTTSVTSDSKTYKPPGSAAFLVDEMRTELQMTLPNSETTAFAATVLGNAVNAPATFADRLLVKAGNVRIDSLKSNIGGRVPDFISTASGNPTIATYHPQFGKERKYSSPKIITPDGEVTLQLSLLSAVAAVVGAATNYGVILSGLLITER